MCGRYTLRLTPQQLAEIFETLREPDLHLLPRYNIAPTQTVAIIRANESGQRALTTARWGLVPSWAKDTKLGASLINARADGVATKPSFRSAFRRRRCLIPADGFFEWQEVPGQKVKQPLFIHRQESAPFAMAGLWEVWRDPEGTPLETCSIITTEPNELIAPFKDRMPVILHPQDYDRWLKTPEKDAPDLQSLLVPYPAGDMQMYPISTLVNAAKNDSPEVLKPV